LHVSEKWNSRKSVPWATLLPNSHPVTFSSSWATWNLRELQGSIGDKPLKFIVWSWKTL